MGEAVIPLPNFAGVDRGEIPTEKADAGPISSRRSRTPEPLRAGVAVHPGCFLTAFFVVLTELGVPVRLCLIGVATIAGFFWAIEVVESEARWSDGVRNGVIGGGFGNTAGVPSGCSSSHLGL